MVTTDAIQGLERLLVILFHSLLVAWPPALLGQPSWNPQTLSSSPPLFLFNAILAFLSHAWCGGGGGGGGWVGVGVGRWGGVPPHFIVSFHLWASQNSPYIPHGSMGLFEFQINM